MKFPPCKHCKHSKSKHLRVKRLRYIYNGWHKRRGRQIIELDSCKDCENYLFLGPTYEWEYDLGDTKVNPNHVYEGDNLALLELKSRRAELTKGNI